jgi:thymidylate synthase (FAD)
MFDANDRDPAQAARMSFGQMNKDRTLEQDMALSKYLMKNWHTSPFEMIEIWLEMKLPIFVARQFVRHRISSINEVSGRYITLPEEWYIPKVVGGKAKSNKQGQEDNLDPYVQDRFKTELNLACRDSYFKYKSYLSEGVAPEHARMFLHLNHYTHWLWKQDLHNMMRFMALRMDSHAQIEAREYANSVYSLLFQFLPETMRLFNEFRKFS